MELTQKVIDIVERTITDDDLRQDFYVQWLEAPTEQEELIENLEGYIRQSLWWRNLNDKNQTNNRARILQENEDEIRNLYTQHDEYAEDPAEIVAHEQELETFLNGLSDTNRRTFEKLYLDGYTPEDLAFEEGVARNAIDQRVHNIKKLVKEKFNG